MDKKTICALWGFSFVVTSSLLCDLHEIKVDLTSSMADGMIEGMNRMMSLPVEISPELAVDTTLLNACRQVRDENTWFDMTSEKTHFKKAIVDIYKSIETVEQDADKQLVFKNILFNRMQKFDEIGNSNDFLDFLSQNVFRQSLKTKIDKKQVETLTRQGHIIDIINQNER